MRAPPFYLLLLLTVAITSPTHAEGIYSVTGPTDAASKVSCSDVSKLADGSWQANAMFTDPSHKVTVNPVFDQPTEKEMLDKRCGKQPEPKDH